MQSAPISSNIIYVLDTYQNNLNLKKVGNTHMLKLNITVEIMKSLVEIAVESMTDEKSITEERIKLIEDIMKKDNADKFNASKMLFASIVNKYDVLTKHEKQTHNDDWYNAFIDFHNSSVDVYKENNYREVLSILSVEYGKNFLDGFEHETLHSLMKKSKNFYAKALKAKYQIEEEQEEKKKEEEFNAMAQELSSKLEEVAKLSKKFLELKKIPQGAGFGTVINGVEIVIGHSEEEKEEKCVCGNC